MCGLRTVQQSCINLNAGSTFCFHCLSGWGPYRKTDTFLRAKLNDWSAYQVRLCLVPRHQFVGYHVLWSRFNTEGTLHPIRFFLNAMVWSRNPGRMFFFRGNVRRNPSDGVRDMPRTLSWSIPPLLRSTPIKSLQRYRILWLGDVKFDSDFKVGYPGENVCTHASFIQPAFLHLLVLFLGVQYSNSLAWCKLAL